MFILIFNYGRMKLEELKILKFFLNWGNILFWWYLHLNLPKGLFPDTQVFEWYFIYP